jgi:hypothetical protein
MSAPTPVMTSDSRYSVKSSSRKMLGYLKTAPTAFIIEPINYPHVQVVPVHQNQ